MITAVVTAPKSASPVDAVAASLQASTTLLKDREFSRRRQKIIVANPELRERELIKMATLASAVADALRRRGVTEPAASLSAEAGIAVFRVAFERWVSDPNNKDLPTLIRESHDQLGALLSEDRRSVGGRSHG